MAAIGRSLLRLAFASPISMKCIIPLGIMPKALSIQPMDFRYLQNYCNYYQFRCNSVTSMPPEKVGQAAYEDEQREFLAVFPDMVHDLTNVDSKSDISDAQKWFSKVLQFNVLGGKMNRGLAVGLSLKHLLADKPLDAETRRKAFILGWCIEMLQSHFLIADDIIDGSETRRGKPCWYKRETVGLGAINDSLLLNAGIYKLLNMYFREEPYYLDMLELFHDVTMKTIIGQCLDLEASPVGELPKLNKFTINCYDAIVEHKTGYYSFYLPVALAMYMAGITDRELHRQARTILLEMGLFFQVQDDYLDCFGNPLVTGKIGTDIADGKCTWLAVVTLQRASNAQIKVMEEHYGRSDQASVDAVRELYKELNLPATYRAYEESTADLIRTHIQQISRGLNHKVFFTFLDRIYQRSS